MSVNKQQVAEPRGIEDVRHLIFKDVVYHAGDGYNELVIDIPAHELDREFSIKLSDLLEQKLTDAEIEEVVGLVDSMLMVRYFTGKIKR